MTRTLNPRNEQWVERSARGRWSSSCGTGTIGTWRNVDSCSSGGRSGESAPRGEREARSQRTRLSEQASLLLLVAPPPAVRSGGGRSMGGPASWATASGAGDSLEGRALFEGEGKCECGGQRSICALSGCKRRKISLAPSTMCRFKNRRRAASMTRAFSASRAREERGVWMGSGEDWEEPDKVSDEDCRGGKAASIEPHSELHTSKMLKTKRERNKITLTIMKNNLTSNSHRLKSERIDWSILWSNSILDKHCKIKLFINSN